MSSHPRSTGGTGCIQLQCEGAGTDSISSAHVYGPSALLLLHRRRKQLCKHTTVARCASVHHTPLVYHYPWVCLLVLSLACRLPRVQRTSTARPAGNSKNSLLLLGGSTCGGSTLAEWGWVSEGGRGGFAGAPTPYPHPPTTTQEEGVLPDPPPSTKHNDPDNMSRPHRSYNNASPGVVKLLNHLERS
jgi:hypothetical protein